MGTGRGIDFFFLTWCFSKPKIIQLSAFCESLVLCLGLLCTQLSVICAAAWVCLVLLKLVEEPLVAILH